MTRTAAVSVILCLAMASLTWSQDLSGYTGAAQSFGGLNYPASQPYGGPLGSVLAPVTPMVQGPATVGASPLGQGWGAPADGGFQGLSPVASGFVSGAYSGLTPAAAGGFNAWTPTGGSWLGAPAATADTGWATAGQLFSSPWAAPAGANMVPAATSGGWGTTAPDQSLVPNSTWATPQAGLLTNTQPLQLQTPSGATGPATQWGGTWLSPPGAFGGNVTPAWAPAQTPGANPWTSAMPAASLTTNPWAAAIPGGLNATPTDATFTSPQPAAASPWAPTGMFPGTFAPGATNEAPAGTTGVGQPPVTTSPWTPTLLTPGSFAPAASMETTIGAPASGQPAAMNPWSSPFLAPAPAPTGEPGTTGLQPGIMSPWASAPLAPNTISPTATGGMFPAGQGAAAPAANAWISPWGPTSAAAPQVQTGGSWLSNTYAPPAGTTTTPAPNPFLPATRNMVAPNYTPYSPFTGQPAAEAPAGK